MDKFPTGPMLLQEFARIQSRFFDVFTYINDLATGLSSHTKLFVDDTSLFSVTDYINASANELNNYLAKDNNWAFQWKMNFNIDPSK